VVGEDLVQEGAAALGDAEAVVELADDLAGAAVGAEGSLLLSLGAGLAVGSLAACPSVTAVWEWPLVVSDVLMPELRSQ